MIDTQNERRSAGCHMALTMAPLPNVGVTRPDRPHIAWVYRGLAERHDLCDLVAVREFLQGSIVIMEALLAGADVRETMAATADVMESQSGAIDALEALSARVDVLEALA